MGKIWLSDWTRAIMVGAFNVLIPAFFLLNMLKMRLRRCRGVAHANDKYTPAARRVLDELYTWRWVSILHKVNLLAEFFFLMQVGVAKFTPVFLSFLNQLLGGLDFSTAVSVCFFV